MAGKNIVITGASTGIGAETAQLLAPENNLMLHYCSSVDKVQEVAKKVQGNGGEYHISRADLSNQVGVYNLVSDIRSEFDRVDILVNNAGSVVKRKTGDSLNWELMERTFSLNVFSVMLMTSHLYPLLQSGKDPCVINITSIAMRSGAPSATIYGATKGALDSFTRGLAKEWAPEIRVNAIAPGVIDTPFQEKFSNKEKLQQFRETIPLQRIGLAHEIAAGVAFIIENRFITGETIDINGGMHMR